MMKMDLSGQSALVAWLGRVGARAKVKEAIAAERAKREAA
jgi:hypothetical protein